MISEVWVSIEAGILNQILSSWMWVDKWECLWLHFL